MDSNNYCVIMAGGTGSRFWPLSRQVKPKQFLDIMGTGKSLIKQTFDRLSRLFPKENIFIVTSDDYKSDVLAHLPDITENQVLLEPYRRNTAPCIAYANYRIKQLNPNASIVVAPSDHLILDETAFIEVLQKGLDFVSEHTTSLLTLGIKPNHPETGYGYIQINNDPVTQDNNLRQVKTFTEKPSLEIAKAFYESGEYFWNSGIFIWSLKGIMNAFQQYLPEVDELFKKGIDIYNTDKEPAFIHSTYSVCPNVSIDYGVMEKAENVYVYISDFGWSDLGTWSSLYEKSDKDENNNVIKQGHTLTYNATGNIIRTQSDKLVVLEGLNDYIVVDTADALLICPKKEEQQIKRFVTDIKVNIDERFI